MTSLLFDTRWGGVSGIGRFGTEVLQGLTNERVAYLCSRFHPLSVPGMAYTELAAALHQYGEPKVFVTPGFAPSLAWQRPQVVTIHDLMHMNFPGEASRAKYLYYTNVVRPVVRRKNVTIATVSEYSKQEIVEWAGIAPERVHVVGNGVSEAYTPEGPAYSHPRPYVLHVGNHKPHKNLDRTIEAFAHIDGYDFLLTGEENPKLRSLSARLGVGNRVQFLGRVPEADLPRLYRSACAVVIPSLYEGFGLPALEAMASGTPVVAANSTSLPEVVGECGFLVDPRSVESIAAGIDEALSHQDDADFLSQAHGRARRFTWAAVRAAFSALVSCASR